MKLKAITATMASLVIFITVLYFKNATFRQKTFPGKCVKSIDVDKPFLEIIILFVKNRLWHSSKFRHKAIRSRPFLYSEHATFLT